MSLKRHIGILIIAIAGMTGTLYAQATPDVAAVAPAGAEPETRSIRLFVGRSAIVDVGTPIARVSLTQPDIADALVTKASEILVNGKAPGTISMFVWERAGTIRRYEVDVRRDLDRLAAQV